MPDPQTPSGQRDRDALIGAMFTDGERLWEVVAYDGTDAEGGPAWLIAWATDDPSLRPRDRASRRTTQAALDKMTRVGLGV